MITLRNSVDSRLRLRYNAVVEQIIHEETMRKHCLKMFKQRLSPKGLVNVIANLNIATNNIKRLSVLSKILKLLMKHAKTQFNKKVHLNNNRWLYQYHYQMKDFERNEIAFANSYLNSFTDYINLL